jgi:F-type H+-transporting ATPase subunit b
MLDALGVNPLSILIHVVNFLILLFLLQRFLFGPVLKMLDDRSATIRDSVEAADRMRQETARADQERNEVLREARRQAEEIVARASQEAERLRAEARTTAQEEAQRIITRAEQEANAERQAAMQDLRAQVADLAISAAERVIHRNLDGQAQRVLVEEFLAETAGQSNGASA